MYIARYDMPYVIYYKNATSYLITMTTAISS